METIELVIPVLTVFGLPAAWLITELLDARKLVRVGLGLAVVAIAAGMLMTVGVSEAARTSAHTRCFLKIGELLDSGDIATVKRAVAAYNEDGKHSPWEVVRVLCYLGK